MYSRSPKRSTRLGRSASSVVGVVDDDELRRRALEPVEQVADLRDRQVLEVGVRASVLGHLGDVELVVDVAVEREALLLDGRDRLPRELERDRLVQQPLARDAGRRRLRPGSRRAASSIPAASRVGECGAEHPAGREHDVDPRCLGGGDRGDRARPQDAVLGDQRPVEVARDRRELARERRRSASEV